MGPLPLNIGKNSWPSCAECEVVLVALFRDSHIRINICTHV